MSTYKAIMKQKFVPYQVSVVYELKAQDIEKQIILSRWFQQFIDMNEEKIFHDVLFTVEALIQLYIMQILRF